MTKEQFNEIKERLSKWREERHLTYENQMEGFLGNVFEEVSEYFRAKDDLERVDALCDIAVFCFNAFDVEHHLYYCSDIDKEISKIENIINNMSWFIFRARNNINLNITIGEIICYCRFLCENFEFDFYKCMIETIKEIESRTGKYDNKLKKFVKDKGAYTKKEAQKKYLGFCFKQNKDYYYLITITGFKKIKKWYKADYESCRLLK